MRTHSSPFHSFWAPLAGAACIALAMSPALAQDHSHSALQSVAQRWASESVVRVSRVESADLRFDVVVGVPDSRLKLALCGNVEAYVPPGVRLWGRSRIGVRCIDGVSRWNVTLPVTVKATGGAWIVKNQLPAGATVTESDVMFGEVDWAEEPGAVITDRSVWLGQTANRTLSTGQAMRQGMVRPAQVFQAGSPVKVVAQGPGFQISSEAQALSAGVIGQPVRVRMDNGRVATGTVLDIRTVKIDL